MKQFLLNLDASINGIYLNSETIELLSIIQCKNIEELKKFAQDCSQLDLSEEYFNNWSEQDIENIKKDLFEKYKKTLIPLKQSVEDKKSVFESVLKHSGIPEEELSSYISEFQSNGYDGVKEKLQQEYPDQYTEIAKKQHRFIASERDQMTEVSYEEVCKIDDNLKNHNTILIGSGRYYDTTNKMYNENVPSMQKYDFYYAQRGLDFCYRNEMHARYHTLLDKQTLEKHLIGRPKEEVLRELQEYVKQSIDFISEYNKTHRIDGKGVISSVDLFNEIISFDEPYRNIWQEIYGISNEELVGVFQYAQENKPEGITYVYNEPFLENPERRKKVLEELRQLNELSPGLIDTIGTQMHIEMTQDTEAIRQCFEDLKDTGVKVQITEFDMCLPERAMFDEKGKVRSENELVQLINNKLEKNGITIENIADFKSMKMKEIASAIKKTGVNLEGVTYWSTSDTLDHNLERTNRKTFEQGLDREVAHTRYAGVYSYPEIEQEKGKTPLLQSAIEATKTSTRTGAINEQVVAIRKEIEKETEKTNTLDEKNDNEKR